MNIDLDFEKENGLVPVIIQDFETDQVLMLGFMNKEAFDKTRETGNVWFYSRSRKKLWMKGETSGNFLLVKEIFTDCDTDSLLIKAHQVGNATCHTGRVSCFYYQFKEDNWQQID